MNRRDLIRQIKEKANQVEVKDFTESIIMKAQSFPYERIEKAKPYFALKPILTMTILVFALILVSVLAIPYLPKKPIQFTNFDEAIAITSLTALNLANQTFTPLSAQTLSNQEMSFMIDDEISQLTSYLSLIEQIVYTDKLITSYTQIDRNRKNIIFETSNLLSENQLYQLRMTLLYESRRNDLFSLGGVMTYNDEVYNIEAITKIVNGKHELTLVLSIDAMNYVMVRYFVENSNHVYEISLYVSNRLTKNLYLIHRQHTVQQEVFIHFVKGQALGSYRFVETSEGLKAHYAILRNGTRETGNMLINVFNHPISNQQMYRFTIQPLGSMPFVVERNRSKNTHLDRIAFKIELI